MRVFQITRGYIQLKLCMQLEYSSLVINLIGVKCFYFFSLFFFKFYFILLYNTVLVLPYINMNLPRVYTCSQSKKVKLLSRVQLFATPWTVAYHTPLSMGFSRQEYWSGLPRPFAEDLPNPGIEPGSLALQADALPSEPPGKGNVFRIFS